MSDTPSKHEANKLVRVLNGKPLKYTARLHRRDGTVIEYQSDHQPRLAYNDQARALWVCQGEYENKPVFPYEEGMVILCEENPKP